MKSEKTELREREARTEVAGPGAGGIGSCGSEGVTPSSKRTELCRSDVQHGERKELYCTVYPKGVQRVGLQYQHDPKGPNGRGWDVASQAVCVSSHCT